MKHYSTHFNKRSRLLKAPELEQRKGSLTSLDRGNLKTRLASLLQIQNDFFPCFDWAFPPPILTKSPPPDTAGALFSGRSIIPGLYSIYLHSPFCKTLCSFCYYPVLPGRGIEQAGTYVDYLIKEMALYAETMQGRTCESIYFGGGTPTYLDDALLARLFEAIFRYFSVDANAEISIEAAPGTLPESKVDLLSRLGVNRISYGIQTLDERLLAGMNRRYVVNEAIDELGYAIERIGNVNVDTMYGFEGEPEAALPATFSRFHEIGVPSLTIYALDTQRNQQKSAYMPPKDQQYERKIAQYRSARLFLERLGYRPVFQNVFVIPGKASYRHQIRRWDNLSLLAFGLSAQGYAPQRAYQNVGSIKSYYQRIDNGLVPVATVDNLTPELELAREVTSKLRFTQVSIKGIRDKYGVDLDEVFADLITVLCDFGYVRREADVLKMTPAADYYNNIIPMLFAPDTFKEHLLGLPDEYIEEFPVPYVITRLGKAQSAPIRVSPGYAGSVRYERRALMERRCMTGRRCGSARPRVGEQRFVGSRRQMTGRRTTDTRASLT